MESFARVVVFFFFTLAVAQVAKRGWPGLHTWLRAWFVGVSPADVAKGAVIATPGSILSHIHLPRDVASSTETRARGTRVQNPRVGAGRGSTRGGARAGGGGSEPPGYSGFGRGGVDISGGPGEVVD